LQLLFLDGDFEQGNGAKAIAAALNNNSALQQLILGGSYSMTDKSAQAIAAALRTNSALQKLNLNYHDIGVRPHGRRH